ncbi:hypothetical protein ASPBRDRAFT_358989 [Aspergillus brasiliensis CBS 101740]|uniref:Uncharacterized protein n=1 Tax=Aspergillus brasiliensis (strain CBS 101740 / IMI 381727 / IBT 21946) TaxID=767769 RepID=A0A1L9U5N8_ASPBC|nr:hypothetical protein ASPBRDRAFT_358989 [Aspergillus brasiliensis CBS 101740]
MSFSSHSRWSVTLVYQCRCGGARIHPTLFLFSLVLGALGGRFCACGELPSRSIQNPPSSLLFLSHFRLTSLFPSLFSHPPPPLLPP